MTDLPVPTPRAVTSEADIQAAFVSLEPGWYTSADLLPTYNAWAKRERKPEITTKTLGEALRRHFSAGPARKIKGNVALRYLNQDILHHRAWFAPS